MIKYRLLSGNECTKSNTQRFISLDQRGKNKKSHSWYSEQLLSISSYFYSLWITGTRHSELYETALMITAYALVLQNPLEYRNQLCEHAIGKTRSLLYLDSHKHLNLIKLVSQNMFSFCIWY